MSSRYLDIGPDGEGGCILNLEMFLGGAKEVRTIPLGNHIGGPEVGRDQVHRSQID